MGRLPPAVPPLPSTGGIGRAMGQRWRIRYDRRGRSHVAFSVQDFHELVRLLDQHPEWRAELRRLVLTEELLGLPAVVRELADAQRRTEEALRELARSQSELARGQ